jgi:hypothetical protein
MKFLSDLPLNPTPRMLRQFAAAWLVAFLALACKFGLLHQSSAGLVLGILSLAGIFGLLVPRVLHWPFVIMTVAAYPIGWVVTLVVLALMFYCVLSPLALVFRWRRRDILQLRDSKRDTFWIKRDDQPPPEKYLKQF